MNGKKVIKITTKAFGIILVIVGSVGTVFSMIGKCSLVLILPFSIIMLVFGSIILQKQKKAALSDGKMLSDAVLEKFGICLAVIGGISIFMPYLDTLIHYLIYYCHYGYNMGSQSMAIGDIPKLITQILITAKDNIIQIILQLLCLAIGVLMVVKYHNGIKYHNRKKLSNDWLCSCGILNGGEDLFCSVCGKPRPKD